MALIIFNPTHKSHHTIHIGFMNVLQFIWKSSCNYIFDPWWRLYCFYTYQIYIHLPIWLRYRRLHIMMLYQWLRLSWFWWLTLFNGHWCATAETRKDEWNILDAQQRRSL